MKALDIPVELLHAYNVSQKKRDHKASHRLLVLVIGGAFLIAISILATHYYLSDLTGSPSNLVTSYRVTANQPTAYRPDPLNFPFPNALHLKPGETVTGYVNTPTDTDYYTFTVDKRSDVDIILANLPKDYDLVLYAPDLSLIVRSMNPGRRGESINLTLNPGKYYIRIYSKSGDYSNVPYSLSLSVIPI